MPQVLSDLLKYEPGYGMDPKELRKEKKQERHRSR
jgi:hypothetical protein